MSFNETSNWNKCVGLHVFEGSSYISETRQGSEVGFSKLLLNTGEVLEVSWDGEPRRDGKEE